MTYLGDKSKEETYILYPVGRHLGICTPMERNKATAGHMSFVPLEREITAVAVSHDAKHVAVVEGASNDPKQRGVQSSRISVFRLDSKESGGVKGTPVKVLRLSEVQDVDVVTHTRAVPCVVVGAKQLQACPLTHGCL